MDNRIFLTPFKDAGYDKTVFVFPHAGSGAGQYFPMAQELAKYNISASVFRYPGRESRINEQAKDIHKIAEEAAHHIAGQSGRISLFGHSFGGYAAFETARLLKDSNISPELLFLSGQNPPELINREYYSDCLKMPDDQFLRWIQTTYSQLPSELSGSGEMEKHLTDTLRNDYLQIIGYQPESSVFADTQSVILNGRQDRSVSAEAAQSWEKHLKNVAGVHYFSGGHFYLFNNIPAVCGLISSYIKNRD